MSPGMISTDVLDRIEILGLRAIGKDVSTVCAKGSSHYVGAEHNDCDCQCVNYRPTYLTNFSAPKLRAVEGRTAFDSSISAFLF
jgi:hypothetical protein